VRVKNYKFVGEHPNLKTGNYYTLREYAEATEPQYKTLYNRMTRYQHTEVDDNFISLNYSRPTGNLEGKYEIISMEWLRKKLTTIDPNYKEHKR
tara:strand:- start:251 stop:532 length:282 start_codon:yes stop_codon:yes gene_type:complete